MRNPTSLLRRGAIFSVLILAPCLALAQSLEATLDRTSRQVSSFLDEISDVKCTEQVSQVKLNRGGHVEHSETGTYDYLVLLQGNDDGVLLNESRLMLKAGKAPKNVPMLVTNGFSMLFLIFHPYYRDSFRFTAEADDMIDGQRLSRVHFAHIPGTRTPAALALRGREFPLDLLGTAWLDPDTGMVARIETTIASDMRDVGLVSLAAHIDYAPLRLPGWTQAYRFPVVAMIDVETPRQHWRNIHRFTDYQRFSVSTEESVKSTQ